MSFVQRIEAILVKLGKASAWILLLLLISIILQVGLNVISSSITWMEELQWYLYGISSMVALSYTMSRNGHVRVDVFHRNFSLRVKKWLETVWILIALIPLYIITLRYGWDFSRESYLIQEGSPDPGGMPFRWIVKAFIPVSSLLLLSTAVLRAILIWSQPELLEETELIHGD